MVCTVQMPAALGFRPCSRNARALRIVQQGPCPIVRTLYLHIGAHRTATSATQSFLARNNDRLRQHGYLPVNGVGRQTALVKALVEGERPVADAARMIRQQAEAGPAIHSAIISDENICFQKDLSIFARFREHFDVRIIFTLRRQDLWLESWYYQNIKWQWKPRFSHLTFPEFMDRRHEFHWIHYDSYIRHLETLFGGENIRLTVHERAQMPGGPIAAFCRHLGLDDLDGFTQPGRVNSSLSPPVAEFARRMPLDRAPSPYRRELIRVLYRIDAELRENSNRHSSLLMTRPERERVMAEFDPGNHAVAQRYFDRGTLFEDPLPPADAPLGEMALPEASQDLMEDYIIPLLHGLIEGRRKKQGKADGGDGSPAARRSGS